MNHWLAGQLAEREREREREENTEQRQEDETTGWCGGGHFSPLLPYLAPTHAISLALWERERDRERERESVCS